MPALKPYWGKPALRNERGDDGNGGIIRSPQRAIVLPNKPRGSLEIVLTLKPLLCPQQGQYRRDRYWQGIGGGNLREPIHVHTMSEPDKRDRRLNKEPWPDADAPSARE